MNESKNEIQSNQKVVKNDEDKSPVTSDGEDDEKDGRRRRRFNKIVQNTSAWFFSVLGEEKNLFQVVDELNEPLELEGFLEFEMKNNRFVKLIQDFLNDDYLSFSSHDGMILNKRPLFDTNSLVSGESQLVLMLPQNVALEQCTLNEDFFLSHFVITSTAVKPILKPEPFTPINENISEKSSDEELATQQLLSNNDENSTITTQNVTKASDVEEISFFSLNQIMGEVNLREEFVKVLKNPHIDNNDETESQILREAYVRLGDYFPVKLLLISNPIWIPKLKSPPQSPNEPKKLKTTTNEDEQLTLDQRFRKNYNSSQSSTIRTTVNK